MESKKLSSQHLELFQKELSANPATEKMRASLMTELIIENRTSSENVLMENEDDAKKVTGLLTNNPDAETKARGMLNIASNNMNILMYARTAVKINPVPYINDQKKFLDHDSYGCLTDYVHTNEDGTTTVIDSRIESAKERLAQCKDKYEYARIEERITTYENIRKCLTEADKKMNIKDNTKLSKPNIPANGASKKLETYGTWLR